MFFIFVQLICALQKKCLAIHTIILLLVSYTLYFPVERVLLKITNSKLFLRFLLILIQVEDIVKW